MQFSYTCHDGPRSLSLNAVFTFCLLSLTCSAEAISVSDCQEPLGPHCFVSAAVVGLGTTQVTITARAFGDNTIGSGAPFVPRSGSASIRLTITTPGARRPGILWLIQDTADVSSPAGTALLRLGDLSCIGRDPVTGHLAGTGVSIPVTLGAPIDIEVSAGFDATDVSRMLSGGGDVNLSFMIFEQGVTPPIPGPPVLILEQAPPVQRGAANRHPRRLSPQESALLQNRIRIFPERLSELLRAANESTALDAGQIKGQMERLEAFLEARFREEDEIMHAAYLGSEGHLAAHNLFRNEIHAIRLMAANGNVIAARTAAAALEEWVHAHGETWDRDLLDFLGSGARDSLRLIGIGPVAAPVWRSAGC